MTLLYCTACDTPTSDLTTVASGDSLCVLCVMWAEERNREAVARAQREIALVKRAIFGADEEGEKP